ncbi:hypothetical protein C0J52_24765 [Blattella germanica]|nr:hypothetical protein C0J52_24765 [Blattella germanica]
MRKVSLVGRQHCTTAVLVRLPTNKGREEATLKPHVHRIIRRTDVETFSSNGLHCNQPLEYWRVNQNFSTWDQFLNSSQELRIAGPEAWMVTSITGIDKDPQISEYDHQTGAGERGPAQATLRTRSCALETENCNLTRETELQRRQYERCLDDVANQVVRALLSQKGLREEIGALQRRIRELEAQNRALASVLVQQIQQGTPSAVAEALSKLPSAQPSLGAGDEPAASAGTPSAVAEALSKLPSAQPSLGAGDEPAASANLALSGQYAPSSCAPETPMTSATSVSTPSSSDIITPDDKRHHQQLITPTSSDLATPEDELPKSRLRKQVTPTSSDLATPDEEIVKVNKVRKHHMAKLPWETSMGGVRDQVQATGAFFTSLKSAGHVDPSVLWLPLQRPRSLNLQLHGTTTGQQVAALAAVTATHVAGNKLPQVVNNNNNNAVVVEDEGSESPESGNRDEGYSTMSSDVQGEAVRSGEQSATVPLSTTNSGELNPRRGLEDLKEVTDETEVSAIVAVSSTVSNTTSTPTTLLVDCSATSNASTPTSTGRLLVVEDACDPDVLYIPLGLALGLSTGNPRHSFPPSRDLLPYQHIMRSFSDSHLCLKITATAPSPSPVNNNQHSSFSLSSTASSSPSVLVLDVLTSDAPQKQAHPLRRTKGTTSLLATALSEHQESIEEDDSHSNSGSWCSGGDVVVEGCWWDADYVQHWLRLDETRSALQQQHRDLMELEYDQAELEDWSMSLSCEDIASSAASGVTSSGDSSSWRRPVAAGESLTPGQQQYGMMLPSIQENNTLELEEDSSECLWNNASYLIDHRNGGSELMSLLMDDGDQNGSNGTDPKGGWPYGNANSVGIGIGTGNYSLASPGGSWSSTGTNSEDCCHSYECSYNGCSGNGTGGFNENSSKRSSAAMSGCSDDAGSTESPAVIGTDFTRDFYRLVKFESTKSLASTSSRSLAGGAGMSEAGGSLSRRQGQELSNMPLTQDREQALQSVLNFIAEQQQYCASREEQDSVKDLCLRSGAYDSERTCQVEEDDHLQQSQKQMCPEAKEQFGMSHNNTLSDNIVKGQSSLDRRSPEENFPKSSQNNLNTVTFSRLDDKKTAQRIEHATMIGEELEEQIHTIIELDTVTQALTSSLEENEIENASNKKGRCSEVELNEQNSSTKKKTQNNNKNVIQDFKAGQCIDLKDILKPNSLVEEDDEGICRQLNIAQVDTKQICDELNVSVEQRQTVGEDQVCLTSSGDFNADKDKSANDGIEAVKDRSGVDSGSAEKHVAKSQEEEGYGVDEHVRSLYRPSGALLNQCAKGLTHSPQCNGVGVGCCRVGEVLVTVIEEEDEHASSLMETSSCREMTESMTSTVSTPDTVVSPANRKLHHQSSTDVSQVSVAGSLTSGSNVSSVIVTDGPPDSRAVSFHERATSKDVIDELNRMIRKGEEGPVTVAGASSGLVASGGDVVEAALGATKLDQACCSSATREQLGVLRYPASTPRPSIIGRDDFFVRYGDKEREAVASFDFLEDISTTSVSGASSCDTLGSSQKQQQPPPHVQTSQQQLQPPPRPQLQQTLQPQQHKKPQAQSEPEMTTPSSEDSDDRTGGQLSFSDSCAASFSGSSASLENQEV